MFRKNGKKLIAKQNLIECVLPKIEDHINPFQVEIIFIGFPLHIIWKRLVFDSFRWLERVAWN